MPLRLLGTSRIITGALILLSAILFGASLGLDGKWEHANWLAVAAFIALAIACLHMLVKYVADETEDLEQAAQALVMLAIACLPLVIILSLVVFDGLHPLWLPVGLAAGGGVGADFALIRKYNL